MYKKAISCCNLEPLLEIRGETHEEERRHMCVKCGRGLKLTWSSSVRDATELWNSLFPGGIALEEWIRRTREYFSIAGLNVLDTEDRELLWALHELSRMGKDWSEIFGTLSRHKIELVSGNTFRNLPDAVQEVCMRMESAEASLETINS